jgi:hypothetical protein
MGRAQGSRGPPDLLLDRPLRALEQVLPREVRLLSIAPEVEHGQVLLEIGAVARPAQAGLGLVGLLERRGEFEDVYPVSVSEQEGGAAEFHYTMRYLPGVADEAAVVAAAASAAGYDGANPQPDAAAAPAPAAASPGPGAPSASRPVPAPSPKGPRGAPSAG